MDENGKVKGAFQMSRILPKFLARFEALGVAIPEEVFGSDQATGI
jgi:hypothetical protein